MRPLAVIALAALLLSGAAPSPARATLHSVETFTNNTSGWTLGAEWQIGPTSAGTGYTAGFADPELDHSSTVDNVVAGTVLGGPVTNTEHGYEWLVSPAMDLSVLPGNAYVSFWWWRNTPGYPFQFRVEVWNGIQWVPMYNDMYWSMASGWQPLVLDVTWYKNPAFKIRFGHARASGYSDTVSGWNIDDVSVWSGSYDVDGDGYDAEQAGGADCNDLDATIHPGATELCNGIDEDCNGLVDDGLPSVAMFPDLDSDGFGSLAGRVLACNPALYPGYVTDSTDCNDGDGMIHPGAAEICNGSDDDCDGQYDEGCVYGQVFSITDVGNDQGRKVRLRWFRDANDGGYTPITVLRYLVFRRVEAGLVARQAPGAFALPPGEWDYLTEVPAMHEPQYSIVVPTLCDSNATGNCRSTFLVRAAHSNGWYVDYPPDSGYSVDNLAPGVPQGFTLAGGSGGAQLTWVASEAADFQYFQVHRGTSASFTPSAATLVHGTAGTSWTDPAGQGSVYYKLVAVDVNGNASAPAVVHSTLGVEGAPAASSLAFASVAPSPFATSVAIAFDVPAGGWDVRLEVLDLAGRRVRTLATGAIAAGRQFVRWDGASDAGPRVAPGVYHLRLSDGARTVTTRVVLAP